MKTKHLLFAMALPLAFTACTNDDFEDNASSPVQKGELVTLPDNYLLSGIMGGNVDTRSIYNGAEFAWLPFDGTTPDAIGLCWRGGEYTSNAAVVYTNYKFEHYGWLGKGEAEPKLDCDGELQNGQLLENLQSNKDALLAGTWAVADASTYPNMKVDAKNGVFNTQNSTIFKGDYIVYYPYNDKFNEVGYIPVTAPTNIKRDINGLDEKNYTKELAKEIFVAGTMNGIEGGQQNGVFSTNFVSGGVVVKIKNAETANVLNIHKVILIADNGFATEAQLDAAKIAAGAKGSALYAAEPTRFNNTLVAEFYDSNKGNAQANLSVDAGKTQRVAFAALPTTTATALKNAKVILVDENEKSYLADAKLTSIASLSENKWNVIEVTAKKDSFTDAAYAYDTESLMNLLTAHNTKTGKGQTINVLNKITLDPDYTFTLPYGGDVEAKLSAKFKETDKSIYIAENVTLTGKGSIVVPANLQLVFKTVGTKDAPVSLNCEVPLSIENKGCCGEYSGTVVLRTNKAGYGTYSFGKIQNEGTLYLGSDLTGVVNIAVDELNNNGGLINAYGIGNYDEEKASYVKINKLTNTHIARETETDAEKVNNGRVNVVAKFWNPADEQKTPATKGTRRVNMTIGQLTNTEGAYVLVGKRTYLDVTGTSTNAGKIKVETAATGKNSEDAEMHIEGAITNTGLIENFGVINNEGALKNNSAEAIIVDHVGCQFGGNKAQATPGEYICDVEDDDVSSDGDRLEYAMGQNMPTTTIRFVGASGTKKGDGSNEDHYLYDLGKYNKTSLDYNFIVATTNKGGVKLQAVKKIGSGDSTYDDAVQITINGTLDVESELNLSKIQLTVKDEVTVNGTMLVNPTAVVKATTTEKRNAFIAEKDVNVKGNFEVVQFAMVDLNANLTIAKKAEAKFSYATYTDVAQAININGTFTRVVSSGSNTANPAQVWCKTFVKGSAAAIPNGLPQVR